MLYFLLTFEENPKLWNKPSPQISPHSGGLFNGLQYITQFFTRNRFISNPVLDSQQFKKLLDLQGKS